MVVIYSQFWPGHPVVSISTPCLSCLSNINESELFAKGISFVANAAFFRLFFFVCLIFHGSDKIVYWIVSVKNIPLRIILVIFSAGKSVSCLSLKETWRVQSVMGHFFFAALCLLWDKEIWLVHIAPYVMFDLQVFVRGKTSVQWGLLRICQTWPLYSCSEDSVTSPH